MLIVTSQRPSEDYINPGLVIEMLMIKTNDDTLVVSISMLVYLVWEVCFYNSKTIARI